MGIINLINSEQHIYKMLLLSMPMFITNGCAGVPDVTAELTPIRTLVEHPTEYFGHTVTVEGFLTYEFENVNIWENAAAEDEHNCKRGIGIDPMLDVSKFNRKKVLITGKFRTWCPENYSPDLGPDDDKCISTGSCGDTEIMFSRIQEVK